MSRSFPQLCAHGMVGEADRQSGKEGRDGVWTGCQHRDVARGRALRHYCPGLQQKQVFAVGLPQPRQQSFLKYPCQGGPHRDTDTGGSF